MDNEQKQIENKRSSDTGIQLTCRGKTCHRRQAITNGLKLNTEKFQQGGRYKPV